MMIQLDFHSDIPIYVQLRNEIIRLIASGQLAYGDPLPTVRALAADLHVNTMTVSKTYALLKQEGFITTDRRHGTRVLPAESVGLENVESSLSLLASEAVIKGMDKQAFLSLCEKLLDNIHYEKKPLESN